MLIFESLFIKIILPEIILIKKRIELLRDLMKKNKINAYIIPGTDPHQSEYIPAPWQRREWISGFTGSNGSIAITENKGGLWTDSRYYIQAEKELKDSGINLFKMNNPDFPDMFSWIKNSLRPNDTVGIDSKLISYKASLNLIKTMDLKNIKIKWLKNNLIDIIWKDRPSLPDSLLKIHKNEFAGETVVVKLKNIRKIMDENKIDSLVLSSLDSISWLFNIRGNDVEFNPVAIAYAVISKSQTDIFIRKKILTDITKEHLEQHSNIHNYTDFDSFLKKLSNNKTKILADPITTNKWIIDNIYNSDKSSMIVFSENPIYKMKAIKNSVEISGLRNAHIRDGIAMVKFLKWLTDNVSKEEISELSLVNKLNEFRTMGEYYKGPSFSTISGYKEHGAIIHYKSDKKTNSLLKPEGLLLLDSGAQYLDGTTDITRTISLGTPTPEEKYYYTYVLKSQINLSALSFPAGSRGIQLDSIARQPLWQIGCNYAHGTGHGVGSYLNVHEGPQQLSSTPGSGTNIIIKEGMFVSIEPGFYKEGSFGVRIENLALIIKNTELSSEKKSFLCFDILTLCPLDITLINKELLSINEKKYINNYQAKVYTALSPHLDEETNKWLKAATKAL